MARKFFRDSEEGGNIISFPAKEPVEIDDEAMEADLLKFILGELEAGRTVVIKLMDDDGES